MNDTTARSRMTRSNTRVEEKTLDPAPPLVPPPTGCVVGKIDLPGPACRLEVNIRVCVWGILGDQKFIKSEPKEDGGAGHASKKMAPRAEKFLFLVVLVFSASSLFH